MNIKTLALLRQYCVKLIALFRINFQNVHGLSKRNMQIIHNLSYCLSQTFLTSLFKRNVFFFIYSRLTSRKQGLLFKFLLGRIAPIFHFMEKRKNLRPCFFWRSSLFLRCFLRSPHPRSVPKET